MVPSSAAPTSADLAARKSEMRRRILAARRACPPAPAAAEAAAALVVATAEFRSASCVAVYAALPDEMSTEAIWRAAEAEAKRLALPRTRPGGGLEFVWVETWEDLAPGRYGVPEPPDGSALARLSELHVVVVPGVAFDRMGGRLGRGGGYYDRALASLSDERPFVVGLAGADQIVEEVPRQDFDERVDAVATERELIRATEREPDEPGKAEARGSRQR